MANKLTFRHVEVIRALVMTGSVTGAASRLNVTQPAISHLLRDIEAILAYPLFSRRMGRLVPTRRAELLFREIQRSFQGLEVINEFGARLRETERQTINVAAVPVASIAVLPNVIREYRRRVGEDFFVIDSPSNEQVLSHVASQKVDIGVALSGPPLPGIHAEVLFAFRAMCLLPRGHRLSKARVVHAEDLTEDPMISTSRFDRIPEIIAESFRAAGSLARPVVECPAATAACAMVEAGLGFVLLDPVAAMPFRNSSVVFKRFEPAIPFVFSAYWPQTEEPHFDRETLLQVAREEFATIDRQFPAGRVDGGAKRGTVAGSADRHSRMKRGNSP